MALSPSIFCLSLVSLSPRRGPSLSPSLYFVIVVSAGGSLLARSPLSLLEPSSSLVVVAPSSEDAEEISYAADDDAVICLSACQETSGHQCTIVR